MGWEPPEKNVQYEYINKRIKNPHYAKTYKLPEDGGAPIPLACHFVLERW